MRYLCKVADEFLKERWRREAPVGRPKDSEGPDVAEDVGVGHHGFEGRGFRCA